MSQFQKPLELALYLFRRLRQLGIQSLHGVPGDYNLKLLDYLTRGGLHWVGNCNELNAGYAADGYARLKGMGAIVTTYGVGELSAMNALAGAYAEQVPIVHIVGSPPLKKRSSGQSYVLHHSLGNHDYGVFSRMYESISVAQLTVSDPLLAAQQIDDILLQCWRQSRPVYIEIPTDMVAIKIEGAQLQSPIQLDHPRSDPMSEAAAMGPIVDALNAAHSPCILVGMVAYRRKVAQEIGLLAEKLGLPIFVTPLAQCAVNEASPCYGGIYAGHGSDEDVRESFERSDLVLYFGPQDTDVTTYFGTAKLSESSLITFRDACIEIKGEHTFRLSLKGAVSALFDRLSSIYPNKIREGSILRNSSREHGSISIDHDGPITHDWLWPYIGNFFRPGDVVVSETGTASFGILETKFPPECLLVNASLWASIGYCVGATQGLALAANEEGTGRRTILFEGDGSFQVSCQEVSTMIKEDLTVTIFVLCNSGYSIERVVHVTGESYNDVARWNYKDILHVFQADVGKTQAFQVRTRLELDSLLNREDFVNFPGVQLVELHMPMLDAPRALKRLTEVM